MIEQNIRRVKERIQIVCQKKKIAPQTITIVAVSKNRSVDEIREVIKAGITNIGENRIQEAVKKYEMLNKDFPYIKWHMVGHLQTNKVKTAVKIFDLIQSVDSLRLIEKIDKEAKKINKIQDILLEIKTSPEATKFGFQISEAELAVQKIKEFKNINLKGLMTIAPLLDCAEKTRPYFRALKELWDKLQSLNYNLPILSMGMSDDFEVAIEEGANMVRLGRAIFDS